MNTNLSRKSFKVSRLEKIFDGTLYYLDVIMLQTCIHHDILEYQAVFSIAFARANLHHIIDIETQLVQSLAYVN